MDLESTVRKSKKIRIYLNPEQRNLVKRWMGVSRFVFNKKAVIQINNLG
ncbi:helix-turn-helix domain-containing protein [Coleofasciculus sp. C1-SOL-03]